MVLLVESKVLRMKKLNSPAAGRRTLKSPALSAPNLDVSSYTNRARNRLLSELRPYPQNARRHSVKQIAKITASIRKFGWTNPILVDGTGQVIAGHGRLLAAQQLGLTEVPTLEIDHLSPAEIRAYRIADNRLAELADWDSELLALELGELAGMDLDFDLEVTGYETAELDFLLDSAGDTERPDPLDDFPTAAVERPPTTRLGDLWVLADHRVLCGNALLPESYETLLASTRAHLVYTDPPYNVPIRGHVSGLGAIQHREFPMAAGEMDAPAFIHFLTTALTCMSTVCVDGAILFVMMDWRHGYELETAARDVNLQLKNLCIWTKTNAGLGSFYRSQHELVYVYKHGTAPHTNTFGLGESGRYRTNVWRYPGANSFGAQRLEELAMHPTMKPVALIVDALKDCSRRRESVLDPFSGSGTTLIAAEKCGRKAHCMELDARYVDLTIERWQTLTGRAAILAATGQTFAEVQRDRSNRGEGDPICNGQELPPPVPPTTRRRRPPVRQEVEHHG